MLTVSCLSCGAPVAFRSHASVMAVCEFCRTTVYKDAGAVRDLGKVSEVLEDYSPIQLGTAGVHGGRPFTVIGRIQLRYDAGMWNEWYLLFEDGEGGWLGEASGQYTLTRKRALPKGFPDFDAVRMGGQHELGMGQFVVSDKRVADCVGGQGELPFRLGEGWQARVADLRRGSTFATVDYSDERPVMYSGGAVTLEGLKCQLLRDDDAIKASAGRYRGRLEALDCPSCGTAIRYLPGMATNLVCQACATRLDASTPQAEVLAAGERHAKVAFTLALGLAAKIGAHEYRVLGAMKRKDDDGEEWSEYLLYSVRGGFFWLVETSEGWWRSDVLDEWPEPGTPAVPRVQHRKASYERTLDYPARVTYAAGAFNWQVKVGDRVRVREFEHGQASLSAESTDAELTWSRSTHVAEDQVRAWFKLPIAPKPAKRSGAGANLKWHFFLWIMGLNFIPLMMNFGETLMWLILGLAAVVLPPTILDKDSKS